MSYDLDGDGAISQLDLRTARQYERSVAEGLTPRERSQAQVDLARQYQDRVDAAASQTGGQDGLHGSLARKHLEEFHRSPDAPDAGKPIRQARPRR